LRRRFLLLTTPASVHYLLYGLLGRVRAEDGVVLNNLCEEVRECLQHAEHCARKAAAQTDPKLKKDFLDMERRWLSLARSYGFTERLTAFSDEKKRQQIVRMVHPQGRRADKAAAKTSMGFACACKVSTDYPQRRAGTSEQLFVALAPPPSDRAALRTPVYVQSREQPA
jgi:hypothetical protein